MPSHVRIFIMINKVIKKIKQRVYRSRFYLQNKATLDKNRELKDSRKGRRCFIIGTGPSIKDQDLTKLRNEDTFVVNAFWDHSQYSKINPAYYVLSDPEVFPSDRNRGEFWQEEVVRKNLIIESCPRTELFLNIAGKEFIEKNKLFKGHGIHFLALYGYFRNNLNFNIDIDRIIPTTKNVILATLIVAVYMGFEEIYLLGCEHSFLAQPAQKYYESFKEFYKTDYNSKDPAQVKRYAMDIMSYEGYIDHTKILFKNYRLFKDKLTIEKPQVKIYNATPHSFLDVFPFVNYGELKI